MDVRISPSEELARGILATRNCLVLVELQLGEEEGDFACVVFGPEDLLEEIAGIQGWERRPTEPLSIQVPLRAEASEVVRILELSIVDLCVVSDGDGGEMEFPGPDVSL